jgi:hypothetical protein
MTDPINFEIPSLAMRYFLHPERRDVFVEGYSDQGLVRAYLEGHGRMHVSVYPISVVNVPAALVLETKLPHPSCRSMVITLALALERAGTRPTQATCVADADWEHVLPEAPACSLLLFTDFASMEMYAFSERTVHSLLVVASPNTPKTGAELIRELTEPLVFLFVMCLTNFDLKYGLAWIENLDRFLSLEGTKLKFDKAMFLNNYVKVRLSIDKAERFEQRAEEIQARLRADSRFQIRGGDFIRLLAWYLRRVEKCNQLGDMAILQMLYLSLRSDNLDRLPLFASLLARTAL